MHTHMQIGQRRIYIHTGVYTCDRCMYAYTHTGSAYDMLLFKNIKIHIISNAHTSNLQNTEMTKKKNMYVCVCQRMYFPALFTKGAFKQ